MLPQLKARGYRYIYIMGVYQLDRPENIQGQAGPDASLFSPLSFSISRQLGGEEALRKLVVKARDEFGYLVTEHEGIESIYQDGLELLANGYDGVSGSKATVKLRNG